jgi:hypothetical protein
MRHVLYHLGHRVHIQAEKAAFTQSNNYITLEHELVEAGGSLALYTVLE